MTGSDQETGVEWVRERTFDLLSLPVELLIEIMELCALESLLCTVQTCQRLRQISEDILNRYKKLLDEHGLRFLPHQVGLDKTVAELQASLNLISQSWIDARYKRRIDQLREATGSADTFIFDEYMMCCSQHGRTRKMELFMLECIDKDPVATTPLAVLSGHDFFGSKDGLGPVGVECYDAGQDLLAFVHVRKSRTDPLNISLYSLRTLTPHQMAIAPVLTIPAHFIDGELEAIFIHGRSVAFFMQDALNGDSIILIRWQGESIFPAIFKLTNLAEQILHMVFLDEDHPMVLTSARKAPSEDDSFVELIPVRLRMLELQPIQGLLSDAITAFSTSYLSEGPHFLFPPLKLDAVVDQEMSWILPYHPASPCLSEEVARQFKPFPYSEPAPHAGVFVVHLGGSLGTGDDDEWQLQITILKSDLLPWRDQPLMDVEWDTWGKDGSRIFQPRPEVDPQHLPDPLKASFMTWVESYRTASIAFDYHNEMQLFHILDFNPNTIRRIKEGAPHTGKLITEPWSLSSSSSPFLVNVETSLPFYIVNLDLGKVSEGAAIGEPCMIRLSSTGVLFERDDPATDETLVGYCWIEDGEGAHADEEEEEATIT